MNKKILIIFVSFIVFFLSCVNKDGIDISDYKVTTLSYDKLPRPVRTILDKKINEVIESYDKLAYSTDKEISFEYYRKKTSNWLDEVRNNDDYFMVNGKIYRKKGNNGDPYIFHKGRIYFSGYNLNLVNYKNKEYYEVVLLSPR